MMLGSLKKPVKRQVLLVKNLLQILTRYRQATAAPLKPRKQKALGSEVS